MRITLRSNGPRPVADVWDRYDDLDRWSEWSPQIRGVRAGSRRLVAGLSGQVLPRFGPGIPFTVASVDASSREWSWTVELGPTSLHLHHSVGWSAAGSATTLTVEGPALLVTPYLPLARFALYRLVH